MNIIRKLEWALLVALIVSIACSFTTFAYQCEKISENVLRMHVIANSDSEADQALKLKVRDAILNAGKDIFNGSVSAQEAKAKIEPRTALLQQVAEDVIHGEGFSYPVTVQVTKEFFHTRTYDNQVTLPAGTYHAVKVVIGTGEGRNWWCVMFPPLCLPAAVQEQGIDAVLDGDEIRVVESDPQLEPRFKLVEFFEKLMNR